MLEKVSHIYPSAFNHVSGRPSLLITTFRTFSLPESHSMKCKHYYFYSEFFRKIHSAHLQSFFDLNILSFHIFCEFHIVCISEPTKFDDRPLFKPGVLCFICCVFELPQNKYFCAIKIKCRVYTFGKSS